MRIRLMPAAFALALALAGCGVPDPEAANSAPATTEGSAVTTASSWVVLSTPADCAAPITVPTLPAVIPGEAEIDPATGLHVTGAPLEVDLTTYRLEVTGLVDRPLSLTYEELRCLPKVEASPPLDCPGYFVDEVTWAGVPLREILERAEIRDGATRVRLTAADGYALEVDLTPETLQSAFLAYEVQGETLPALHGFPVRFVWPDHEGFYWVKWLVRIEVR